MSTSPSTFPFFFPTTIPAYAPTTVFSPPPFGFDHSTSQFPFVYSAPPAFPDAGTYPYPPPASAYTPAPGFFPEWPNRPPPAPDPTFFTAPPASPSPIPTQIDPNWSPATPSTITSSAPAYDPVHTSTSKMQPELAPEGLADLAPLLKLPDREIDAFQRDTRGTTALARLPLDGLITDAFDHAPEVTSSAPISMPHFFSSAATGIGFGSSASSSPTAQTPYFDFTPSGSTTTAVSIPSTLHTSGAAASSSTTAYVAQQLFGEMPRPSFSQGTSVIAPRYENCCSGYSNQIQSSCEQGGSTNLTEQHFDGMPQPYGFDNLNRQSLFLADGTEHSYFALPADYPLPPATPPVSHSAAEIFGVSTPPSVAAQVACLAPGFCSKANNAAGSESILLHNRQVPTSVQYAHDLFEEMPLYDVYEEDTNASLNCAVELFDTVGQHKQYDGEKAIYHREEPLGAAKLSSGESDNELLAVRFSKASDIAVSEEATDFTFSHGPVMHAERSIKLTNEKGTQAASILSIHEAIVHCHDARPEHINCTNSLETVQLNFAQEDILTSGTVTNVVNSKAWESVAPLSHCINHAKLRLLWDPGSSASLHSIKPNLCNQFGTYGISTDLGFTFSEDRVALDCSNMPTNTCFSAMRSVNRLYYSQGHGVENRETLQWDPIKKGEHITWNPGASLPFISSKVQHPGQALQPATHAATLADSSVTCFSGCTCLLFCIQNNIYLCWESKIGMTTYFSWGSGVLNIIDDMMLDKYLVSHQVQFIQPIVEHLFLSLTACIQYVLPNGINSVLHTTSFILQRAAHLSQGTHPTVTHFSRSKWQPRWIESNISMWWKSSMEQIAYLPWDPGLGIHCVEIMGCSPAYLIQQGRNVAVALHLWRSIFLDLRYRPIFQKCKTMSSQLYWHEDIKFMEFLFGLSASILLSKDESF